MQDYINHILKNNSKFKVVNLNYSDNKNITNTVLETLKLTNINQLRDKYEGVSFYENFTNKISGVIAIEKLLNVEIIDWKNVSAKNYIPKINIDNKEVDIITASDRDFPVINIVNDKPAIICLRPQEKFIWVCGFADKHTLNEFQNDKLIKGYISSKSNETAFIGFDKLKAFDSMEELKNLMSI